MTQPTPNFDRVPVRGRFFDYNGAPMQGRVTFTPRVVAHDSAAHTLVYPSPIVFDLVNGEMPEGASVPATDDPDIAPAGFVYAYAEAWTGGRRFNCQIPLSYLDVGVWLDTLGPAVPEQTDVTYVTMEQIPGLIEGIVDGFADGVQANLNAFMATKGQPGGLASLDAGGFVPETQLPDLGGGTVQSVAGVEPDAAGNVPLTKAAIGLGNVDNTSDVDKPISTAAAAALAGKVDDGDPRLTDAREPTAHADTHATAGSDPITPGSIAAAPEFHTHEIADVTDLQDALNAAAAGGLQPFEVELGAGTDHTVEHNLNTPFVIVTVFETATGETVDVLERRVNENTVFIGTSDPVVAGAYTAQVIGARSAA